MLKGSSASSAAPPRAPAGMADRIEHAMKIYHADEFGSARPLFQVIANQAHLTGLERTAAMNWNNAGACSLALMQYGAALADFTRARKIAESSRQTAALASTLNNLANLYLHMGQPENALTVAREGLNLPSAQLDADVLPKTRFQLAYALMQLNRFDEAEPIYLQSVNELVDQDAINTAASELGMFGAELVRGQRLGEAEWALSEGLRLARLRHFTGYGNILRGLAQLRSAQGNGKAAARLFDAAIAAPPGIASRWGLFMDRGRFRLSQGDFEGALIDFQESRRIVRQVRADIVPVDSDRVALEGGLSDLMEGLVDAGNHQAQRTGDEKLLRETFDAAEQDRFWSLRALVPSADDWRTRLPEHYWDLLMRYQTLERASVNGGAHDLDSKASPLKLEMQQIEAGAAGTEPIPLEAGVSPLTHVQKTMGADSVLFSFHVTKTSSWVWAVDREHTAVFPLPSLTALQNDVAQFTTAVKAGEPGGNCALRLYLSLFGKVPNSYLKHTHWLLEPDGPLYDLPFAALVTALEPAGADRQMRPVYLIERAALQSIPSALLMERGAIDPEGDFLGVGDPIYNRADPRFDGRRGRSELTLPRLPNTSRGLEASAQAWNPDRSRLLEGISARMDVVQEALKGSPAIIHFATHVVASEGEFRSGLIALSLGRDGAMGLLGPREIVARPVQGSLVVMDGCYSSRGQALPGAGLMGLTRAWIGAGARAVLATQWEIPDEAAQAIMTNFYRALKKSPEAGLAYALREAQILELRGGSGGTPPGKWAAYFLLSRI